MSSVGASGLSEWLTELEGVFAQGGPLAQDGVGFRPRSAQTEMALAVGHAIEMREALVVEAGTGIGKTFAYLVPTLLSGGRALISTATKSLQDQLYLRDLPALRSALKLPVNLALLKGRGSYLCTHRLTMARQSALLTDRGAVRALARIETWAPQTNTGDFAEIEGLDERSSVLPLVSSNRDNCLGSDCPDFKTCHVVRARRTAMAADVVVVNHHLFFADLAVRESGMAELLPTVDVVVFDEAHQLVSAGVQFLGLTLGSAPLMDLARDLTAAGLQHARGLAPWQMMSAELERSARELRLACAGPERLSTGRIRWADRARHDAFQQALDGVAAACGQVCEALMLVKEAAPDFPRLCERTEALRGKAQALQLAAPPGRVRWIDVSSHHVRLTESPLDIRDTMRTQLASGHKAWIFTSATLGDDDALRWFTEPAGLEEAKRLRLYSPFDYPGHARLYVPQEFPAPHLHAHPEEVAALALRCAQALGGRTFVLTTTLRALQLVAQALERAQTGASGALQVLMQGQSPKRQLLQQFVAQPASILVGSYSFWEGIDVPGEALQCVVIDKLPFPPPGDAIVEARVQQLRAQGRDPFNEHFVAEAAIALKQGAGRLIRNETDHGLIVVCDPRLHSMRYGPRLTAAMPPATPLASEDEALAYLRKLRA